LIDLKLLLGLSNLKDIFSKIALDTLAPHCIYNHKIELEPSSRIVSLGYSPLCQHTLEELLVAKKYILENLEKGFLELGQVLFATLILFSRKSNKLLQLCINYYKLNNITYKDNYLIPLVDKTLSCISKAKIFTKLDIY
jgi:hypothetical protein